jgi:predicted ATPase/transcriptional regulator with XRE-family HTH domain/Tfp pilus assembly protein PilF
MIMRQLQTVTQMNNGVTFGAWIKRLRKAADLTQDDLAERVGYASATICKIEAGERRPSREIADRLAHILLTDAEERTAFVAWRARGGHETPYALGEAAAPAPALWHSPNTSPYLPVPSTSLIGRAPELAGLAHLLAEPDCRLITLVGPGGVGKTHLAIQAATAAAARLAHSVYFVSLASVALADGLVPAIAGALGFTLAGAADASTQLLGHLRDQELLLVLDNVEHLIDSAAALIADILMQAPGLKLLVTSRERLRVQGEWAVEVAGLPVPHGETVGEIESAGAVALFLRRAHQAQPDFCPTEEDLHAIVRICRLVEGMPIGIEMAAAWVRMLSCAEIAAEITRGPDFLVARARDVPARHGSLRAVFDHSWRLLSDLERRALRRLSVFGGGFTRAAAAAVLSDECRVTSSDQHNDAQLNTQHSALLTLLVALVDKSLLRHSGAGRYDMHELVRQYAAAHLQDDPCEHTAARDQHSAYYAAWLRDRQDRLKGAGQPAALAEISAEIDNLRLAWDWATERRDIATIRQLLHGFARFYELRSWFQEGTAAFQRTAAALRAAPPSNEMDHHSALQRLTLGELLARMGWFYGRLGWLTQGADLLHESLALIGERDRAASLSATLCLGIVAYRMGDYAKAQWLLDKSLALARSLDHHWSIALSLCYQGLVAHARGDYQEARRLLCEALALNRAGGEARATALALSYLGVVELALGEPAQAQALLHESLAISSASGDRWGMATTLNHLGLVARAASDADQARSRFEESLALFRALGDYWGIGQALTNLGDETLADGDHTGARRHFLEAVRTAVAAQTTPVALDALAGLARALAAAGEAAGALELLAHVQQHPSSRQAARERARLLARELESVLPPEQGAAVQASALTLRFETLVETLVGEQFLVLI